MKSLFKIIMSVSFMFALSANAKVLDYSLPEGWNGICSVEKKQVTGISFSSDKKSIIVTGTDLDFVNSVALYKSDGTTLIDTMSIDSKSFTQLIAKPSKNVAINDENIIVRLLK